MISKKDFFKKKTTEQILSNKDRLYAGKVVDLAERIGNLGDNEALIVQENIVPLEYYPFGKFSDVSGLRTEAMRKFVKHGPEVKLKRQYTLEQMTREKKTPVVLRKDAFDSIQNSNFSGYSFMPVGNDRRKRKVCLRECLEGAKLYYYAENSGSGIELKNYGTIEKAQRIQKDGSTFVVSVPSRTLKKPRYSFKMSSVPTFDSDLKYTIWQQMGSDHSCDHLKYRIGYNFLCDKENSVIFNFDAHEIAVYFKIIDELWNKDKNIVPLQMSPFAIPTEDMMKYYNKAKSNVVIEYLDKHKKVAYAPLNMAELEIALWDKVRKEGHDKTFYATKKLVDYQL